MGYTVVLTMDPEDTITTAGQFVFVRLGSRLVVLRNSSGTYTLVLNANLTAGSNGSAQTFSVNTNNYLLVGLADETVHVLQETA